MDRPDGFAADLPYVRQALESVVSAVPATGSPAFDLGLGITAMRLETVQGVSGYEPLLSLLNSVKSAFLDEHEYS
jgi:hypothetical protein